MLLHDREEFDNDLRARSDQDLALACLLGIVDGVERIIQDTSADHGCGVVGLSRVSGLGRGVK